MGTLASQIVHAIRRRRIRRSGAVRGLLHRTLRRGAFAVFRDPPVARPQQFHCARNPGQPDQRPRPPDLSRERHGRVGASKLPAIGKQKTHLAQQFFARQAEQRRDSRILQGSQGKPAAVQSRGQPARDSRAKVAFRIPEKPAARAASFAICEFRSQRNHVSLPLSSCSHRAA